MPRLPIDYQKCVMYKLCCNNINVTDIYVGHTSDFIRRKQNHKGRCNNKNSKDYNFRVYQFIREHGGFENWSMIEIEKFPCFDTHEATARERYWIENLKAMLNMRVPNRTQTEKEEYKKDYKAINAEKINEQNKEYRVNNAGKKKEYYQANIKTIKEYQKDYQAINAETIKTQKKIYYQANAETLKAVTNCECGGRYTHAHEARHLKSKNHLLYCSQIN